MPLCPPQTPHGLGWDRTPASVKWTKQYKLLPQLVLLPACVATVVANGLLLRSDSRSVLLRWMNTPTLCPRTHLQCTVVTTRHGAAYLPAPVSWISGETRRDDQQFQYRWVSIGYRHSDRTAQKTEICLRCNTLRTGLLNCLNARSRGLTFRHRASCI